MGPNEWRRIESVFEAIEEEPDPAAWPAILDSLCGDDAALRARAEQLIRASQSAADFLEDPASIPIPPSPYRPLRAGDALGPYRIVRRLGEGGMGTVFLADRADGSFDLQVAIKVLRHGTEGRRAILQFERERQILAGLDHPRIARLLDGGATESGLPYVVMEYVEGEQIDRACERLGLSVTAKVDLMLQVCDAVTAAHRALVVHRDIKPSNILIDADGQPKLLDFGIAKLLAEDSPDAGATSAEVRRLTPAHASPEQVRGEAVTVATDVYLLGLVLYQLLAGEPPFEVAERTWLEIEKALSRAPKRPSDLAPGIDADLDAIILKALRAEPGERYGSVEALSEDLRRHRRGLPVQARAGSVRYVIGKTLRRRWLPLSVAALFATTLTAFAISTALQARELERTLGRLTAVHGFVLELIAGADPEQTKGQEVSVADLLRRGERQLELGYPDDGETRAMLHAVFGRLALHTGRLDSAQGHLEAASGDGLGDDPAAQVSRVRALSDLALTELYRNDEAAESTALTALAAGRRLDTPSSLLLLELLNTVAYVYCWDGRWSQAQPLVEEARMLAAATEGRPSPQAALALSLSAALFKNLDDDLDSAQQAYRESLALYRMLEGDVYPDVANIHNQLGVIEAERGHLEEALVQHGHALDVRRSLYPEGHWEIAQSLYHRGVLNWRLGDLASAETSILEGWSYYAEHPAFGREHGWAIFLWIHLAEVRLAQGRVEDAERMLGELTEEWWASRKPTSRLLPLARRATGCVAAARGKRAEAEEKLGQSLDALRKRHGDDGWPVQLAEDCLLRLS